MTKTFHDESIRSSIGSSEHLFFLHRCEGVILAAIVYFINNVLMCTELLLFIPSQFNSQTGEFSFQTVCFWRSETPLFDQQPVCWQQFSLLWLKEQKTLDCLVVCVCFCCVSASLSTVRRNTSRNKNEKKNSFALLLNQSVSFSTIVVEFWSLCVRWGHFWLKIKSLRV